MSDFSIKANLVDVVGREIFGAEVFIREGRIERIKKKEGQFDQFIVPGFVDAHIHIESSMVTPVEFSRVAISHGTVGVVSDPHEIGNVLGISGVKYMLKNSEITPLKILFGAPSCVPATNYESSGASISASDISELFKHEHVGYLSEMMNYPGVIYEDAEVLEKLKIAKDLNYPIDGHAPGIRGEQLRKYAGSGITTDHECFTIEEAREKIANGMYIQIREGSGAKNFENLVALLNEFPDKVMFCSDDLHPDDLIRGHINLLVLRALKKGYDLFDVLRAAGFNAIKHYKLNVGLLQEGDPADFLIVDSLENWEILKVCINGTWCLKEGKVLLDNPVEETPNKFTASKIQETDLVVKPTTGKLKIIKAIDGELITNSITENVNILQDNLVSDTGRDILKLVVINRYNNSKPAVAFINGFGLKRGAIASSIAHDSHNIISVGASDTDIAQAVNWIIENRGGIVAYEKGNFAGLPLPVAGIMTNKSVAFAAEMYKKASELAVRMGSELTAPFMTLAFMSLLVIPELKLSDKGLFDGKEFRFTPLFE